VFDSVILQVNNTDKMTGCVTIRWIQNDRVCNNKVDTKIQCQMC